MHSALVKTLAQPILGAGFNSATGVSNLSRGDTSVPGLPCNTLECNGRFGVHTLFWMEASGVQVCGFQEVDSG